MPASYGGSGGSSGPTTPALALRDLANTSEAVIIGEDGVGATLPASVLVQSGLTDDPAGSRAAMDAAAIPTAGLDAARPSPTTSILGALYSATDTGVRYLCESDGSGGARWVVLGAVPRIDCDGDSPAWTDSAAGGATAAFTGGVATLTAPSGVAVSAADRARSSATLASLSVPDPWRVRLEARLQTYNAAGARRAALGLSSVASINGADYSTGDAGVFAFVLDAGTLAIYDHVASTFTLRATSSITLALDGQDWLALEQRAESIRVFHGRGSTRPTSWDLAATATWGGGVGGTMAKTPLYALLTGYRTDTTASVFTAAWSGVRVQGLL